MAHVYSTDWRDFLLSFNGRTSRSEYWMRFAVPYLILGILISFVDFALTGGVLGVIYSLLGIWPSVALAVRRCHDRDRSGWFTALACIPILNLWFIIEVGFLRGTVGPNQYGSDPLA